MFQRFRGNAVHPRVESAARPGRRAIFAQPARLYHRPHAARLPAQRDTTLHAIDDFIEGYLAYETRAERILAAADADPGSCLANVYAGLLWMLLEAAEGGQARA